MAVVALVILLLVLAIVVFGVVLSLFEKPRIAKHKNMKKAKAKAFKRDG
ncbi:MULTISPECIES: hypothetical protein [Pseudomonadaceae]|jgi:Na+-transporting methylmalonyl-CoA/oxaloacetate decarboxylase gamma subunit|nr:hypothetical protein [Pseudomonas mendocina]|tara:strand:- start:104 stop:250 length:147 start_codon:yes stop_codon:yes gene_type:complete